jgi:hypothetical protein
MYPSSRRLRAAALAVVLGGAGLLAAAPASQAATLGMTVAVASVSFDDDPDGGVTCTQTGPGDVTTPTSTFAANGVPVTSSVASSAVVTDNANALDKTTMSGSLTSTVTGTGVGGDLSHLHLAASGTTSLTTAAANTRCHASVGIGGGAQFQFDLAAPALVTLTAESHHLTGVAEVGNIMGGLGADTDAVAAFALGGHGTSTSTALLPAGTGYVGISQILTNMEATSAAATKTITGDIVIDISFDTPGLATGTQAGSAGKYVALGAGRSCASGTLPLTWSKKAGSGKHRVIKKATVSVNGAKVATIKKPKKNQVSTVSGLNPERAADVEVSFKIKGKGKFSVERSYLRCT